MTTAASSSSQQASLSRLARLKANLGLKQLSHAGSSRQTRRYTDANESEWYIPYNGPYERPKQVTGMGKVKERDSWADIVGGGERVYDPFERDINLSGYGGASTSGHGHSYTYGSSAHGHAPSMRQVEEHERGRQTSPISKYSDSFASLGVAERRSQIVTSPAVSPISPRRRALPAFLDLDAIGVGIGESPMPAQRVGHSSNSGQDHDPHEHHQVHTWPTSAPVLAAPNRDSTASFWTFGRSSNKRSPTVNVSSGRPSADSRRSTGTRQTTSKGNTAIRNRSATVVGQIGDSAKARPPRPRANTVVPPTAPAMSPSITRHASDQPPHGRHYADDRPEPDRTDSPSYQRHPYATATSPTGHRLHSQILPSAEPKQASAQRRSPVPIINVPFLSTSKSFSSLRNTAKNLKTSVSTPNLRGERPRGGQASGGGSSVNSPGAQSSASSGPKWLSPETWCDALLFPRPRFRMRSAHIISPPTSPMAIHPPYSAPAQTQSQSRTLKRSMLVGSGPTDSQIASHPPSSAPPVVAHPNPDPEPSPPQQPKTQPDNGPSQKNIRPPRPKSFALDDLAIPSPVPSLATVLRQNEEFDRERGEWKIKATRSFANKRSRSLSRSRIKSRAKATGKPSEAESELALSFDLIAATAFHGSQKLKPHVHYGQSTTGSGSRSGVGTNTTTTGLNTMSTHSRNTSNASRKGSATSRGHARKESWSKTAIRTAKQTAHATGLCSGNEELSPADEKILGLDGTLPQDRTKYVHLGPRDEKADEGDVLLITAEASHYLNAPQVNASAPALSPVPSERSGEGVGIALSTPTVLVDQPFQFSDHPYSSDPDQRVEIPRPAEYAGPHPSRMAEFVLNEASLNDVAARHRLHITTSRSHSETSSLHPYAAIEHRPRPTLRVPVASIPPPKKMFADVGTGSIREVMPDDIQYSPYSAQHSDNSKRNSESLGVEEALNLAFSHSPATSEKAEGKMEGDNVEAEDFGSRISADELIAPPILRPSVEFRDVRMPQIDENSVRESWPHSQEVDENGNLLVPTPMSTVSFKPRFSPGQASLESSPMTSPRQFKKFDDMEDYSDLFYRPGQPPTVAGSVGAGANSSGSSGQPTPPNELDKSYDLREQDTAGGFQRPLLTRSNSALANLGRKLSEEYGANLEDHHLNEDANFRKHVSDLIEVDEDVSDLNVVLAQGSPPGASLPLRLGMTRPESPGPSHVIPEDVESSRASSILERFETEEGTEVYYRLGEVPALATPDPVTSTHIHRVSAHGSYIDTSPLNNHRSLSPDDRGHSDPSSRPSLLQPLSATVKTRESYMTSTSSASHISQLSEFPVPPGQTSLTPGTIIQSYFGGNTPEPAEQRDDPANNEDPDLAERKRRERQSRRTTFGPVSDEDE